jgi:hypothetical protein
LIFENSIFNTNILIYFNRLTKDWEEHKFDHLNEINFFQEFMFDFNFSLEKFLFILNKNDYFFILTDREKNFHLNENFKILLYAEKYEILLKNHYDNFEGGNIINSNIFNNHNVKKMLNILDILSIRFKIFTNVFFYFENNKARVKFFIVYVKYYLN